MNLVIEPRSAHRGITTPSFVSPELELGGTFYDYLCEESGGVVGIRYYLMMTVNFESHVVFSQFIDDKRFVFERDTVDMVTADEYAAELQRGALKLSVVQDFGSVEAVRCQNGYGISIELNFYEPGVPRA